MSDIDIAAKAPSVGSCVAPCGEMQPESGKHKPCGKEQPFVGGFHPTLRKTAVGTKISR